MTNPDCREVEFALRAFRDTAAHASPAARAWPTARTLEKQNRDILRGLRGDVALRSRNENTPASIQERIRYILSSQRSSLSGPTKTQQESYTIASEEFTEQLSRLRKLVEVDLQALQKALDEAGAPWTPGRVPQWQEK